MEELLADIALVVAKCFEVIGQVGTTIVSTPLLLLTVGFLFVGGCIGLFGRLLSRS